jgi:hypothetical protein
MLNYLLSFIKFEFYSAIQSFGDKLMLKNPLIVVNVLLGYIAKAADNNSLKIKKNDELIRVYKLGDLGLTKADQLVYL